MTSPNFDVEWLKLPETSLWKPKQVSYDHGETGMLVQEGRRASEELVWLPMGVLLIQMQLEMSGDASRVVVGISQNGKRKSCFWLTQPKTGFYTKKVIIDDPKARLYVTQYRFTSSALNDSKVGITVVPMGVVPRN